jgi:hypothetical protein
MNLWRRDGGRFVFHLARRDRALLRGLVGHYPLVPPAHHRLTLGTDPGLDPAGQALLEEAMSGRKEEQKRWAEGLLGNPRRCVAHGAHYRLSLSPAELEGLLQVLNDIRVGSWLQLGCPDPEAAPPAAINESNERYLFLMEASGYYECLLLEAMEPG